MSDYFMALENRNNGKRTAIFFPVIKGTAVRDTVKRGVLHLLARKLEKAGKRPFFVFLILEKKIIFKEEVRGLDHSFVQIPNIPWNNQPSHFFFRRLRNFLFASINHVDTYRIFMREQREKHLFAYMLHKSIDLLSTPWPFSLLFKLFMRFTEWCELFLTKPIDKWYARLYDKYKPSLLLLHSYQDINLIPLERVAKRKGIPFLSSVMSWDNLTSNGEIPIRPDKLMVWSELMKGEAIKYHYFRKEDLSITGPLQFDYHKILDKSGKILPKKEFFRRNHLDPSKKVLTYTTASPLLFPEEPQFVDYLHKLVRKHFPRLQIFVRIYAKDKDRGRERYRFLEGRPGLVLDYSCISSRLMTDLMPFDDEFLAHLSATMKHSDIVMNFISTIDLDAFVFDKPTINVSFEGALKKPFLKSVRRFQDYSHSQYIFRSGGARFVDSEKKLLKALGDYLKDPALDREKRAKALRMICGEIDTKANERIAGFVAEQVLGSPGY
ncbi:hypothetical protein JW711_05725 [Candidatus Woesearchaeota archaeon]|nr:hypothetical protein [Candidatus Woesearchaeota archaeon]